MADVAHDSQLQTLLNYLVQYNNTSRASDFIREVAERSPHRKERLMTIAERLRQEGRHNGLQEGLQQGRQQGTREEALRIARMMQEKGIDRDAILAITGLSVEDAANSH
ncbi:transposase [Salmonella enterica]|uniref:Transposase n=10 Tax=Salmonella enterica TaxID=28901 RepID=A0A344R009_SALER|nr:transposase [Salmonella enterica subsp. salamae serovar 56:b:[1,5]]EAA4436712.1 transposase [Salmonella enterica subsp. salamae]EAA8843491.1 transposase [Salmonella enterica subsp. enterica]EAM5460748.1 transposase [Salmonella enterica]EBI0475001.1 transposase [Salmonella enterica subsp. enterica serovar Braenderup]ECG1421678.1 transposase [Salmonella enterica subsp. salamae str. CFSAN000559]ECI2499129.1 transposase [Salmonella enterica subsp. enterica serovar Enteritidis]ECT8653368.1 tra